MVSRGPVSAALLVCLSILQAQQPPALIQVDAREVVVDVMVTDGKNNAVHGLTKDDFKITDEGKPREIAAFSVNSEYPEISAQPSTSPLHLPPRPDASGEAQSKPGHSTAIVLDEVNTFAEDAGQARQNIANLMKKVPADERIALYVLVRFKGLVLLSDFTTDHEQILRSLRDHNPVAVSPSPLVDDMATSSESVSRLFAAGTDQPIPPGLLATKPPPTDEEKAAKWRDNSRDARESMKAIAQQLAATPGRKSIFWVTNAFNPWVLSVGKEPNVTSPLHGLNMERPAWDKTFAALNEANTAVNVVDSAGVHRGADPGLGTIAAMQEIADRTGGNAYFGRNDLDGAIADGIAASRVTYTLRFRLPDEERDKTFHTLKVNVNRPGLQLFYRQGYYAGGVPNQVDLVAGKVAGQDLETRAARVSAGALDPAMQLSWFYTAANRASVHLAAEIIPAGLKIEKDHAGLHGQIEIVGIALRPDGAEASRFADTVKIDFEDQQHAEAFIAAPWRYHHQFTLAPGTYLFRLQVGVAPNVAGKKEGPLNIERWNGSAFAMAGIALSTETRPPAPGASGLLVASGREFVPAPTNRFRHSDHVYFYSEIYDPAAGANLTVRYRILAAGTGETKIDTGPSSAGSIARIGNPTVPLAMVVPVAKLEPGSYRMELTAGHSSDSIVVTRTIDFELNP